MIKVKPNSILSIFISIIKSLFGIFSGPKLNPRSWKEWEFLALRYAKLKNIDETYILAIIMTESQGDPQAKGSADEKGLMQLTEIAMIDCNQRTGSNFSWSRMYEPNINIDCGTTYLKLLMDNYGFNINEAIQAYNIGVKNLLMNKNISTAQNYLDKVLEWRQKIISEWGSS